MKTKQEDNEETIGRAIEGAARRRADDVYDYAYRLQNALKLIDASDELSNTDKELIKGFITHLRAKRVSAGRLAKYVFTLKNMVKQLGDVEIDSVKRSDIEKLSVWIQEQHYAPHTVTDYLFALKYFFKFVRSGNTDRETPFPEEVRWLKAAQKVNERREPEFFTSSEVEALIRSADKLRDKCMLSVSFERGMRPSELLLMNVRDATFDGKGARLRIRKGKTGERTVRIISSASLLSRYLEVHPLKDNPDAPLWVTESTNQGKGQRNSDSSISQDSVSIPSSWGEDWL